MADPAPETVEERSAGGVVVRHRGETPHALVIRDPYKNWGLPKGHIEPHEDAAAAALREVREETGLQEVELREELGTIDWWFHKDGARVHKYCTFFLMTCLTGDPEPEEGEGITACVWLPLDQALRRITYDNARAMVREAARRLENGAAISGVGEQGD